MCRVSKLKARSDLLNSHAFTQQDSPVFVHQFGFQPLQSGFRTVALCPVYGSVIVPSDQNLDATKLEHFQYMYATQKVFYIRTIQSTSQILASGFRTTTCLDFSILRISCIRILAFQCSCLFSLCICNALSQPICFDNVTQKKSIFCEDSSFWASSIGFPLW